MMGQKSIHHLCAINKMKQGMRREFSFSLGLFFPVIVYKILLKKVEELPEVSEYNP